MPSGWGALLHIRMGEKLRRRFKAAAQKLGVSETDLMADALQLGLKRAPDVVPAAAFVLQALNDKKKATIEVDHHLHTRTQERAEDEGMTTTTWAILCLMAHLEGLDL